MPKISVIMPAYNAEKYIGEAIESILNQTFADFEFIIIDDGSTDGTVRVATGYNDGRIRFYQNEHNMGVAATLNRGLELVVGEYIARMDSDDISLPERFEKQARYMDEHPECAVLGAGIEMFFAQRGQRTFSQTAEELKVDLLFGCCFAHPVIMLRAKYFGKDGFRYDNGFNRMEDYDLWDRVSQEHDIAALPDVLLQYRIHPDQVTQKPSEENKRQMRALKQRQLERLGISVSEEKISPYIAYCLGELEPTEENVKALAKSFSLIEQRNKAAEIYDDEILRNYLTGILKGQINGFPMRTAVRLTRSCGINSARYAAERSARGAIARAGG